jgi:hypothetical protein
VIADHQNERLGRSDVILILFRRMWRDKLKAVAEGQAAHGLGQVRACGCDFTSVRVKPRDCPGATYQKMLATK